MLAIHPTNDGISVFSISDESEKISLIKSNYFSFCVEPLANMEAYAKIFDACPNMIVQHTPITKNGSLYKNQSQIVLEAESICKLQTKLQAYTDNYYFIEMLYDSGRMSSFHNHIEKVFNAIIYRVEDFSLYNLILPSLRDIIITNILTELC